MTKNTTTTTAVDVAWDDLTPEELAALPSQREQTVEAAFMAGLIDGSDWRDELAPPHGSARLSNGAVMDIRHRAGNGMTQVSLAAIYPVIPQAISRIVRAKDFAGLAAGTGYIAPAPQHNGARGARSPRTVLTAKQARAIIKMGASNPPRGWQKKMAAEMGVSAHTVSQANRGQTWAWLPGRKGTAQ